MICQICNKNYKNLKALSGHINKTHKINYKDYYNKFIKTQDDGICLKCKNKTNWNKKTKTYYRYCSSKCGTSASDTKNKKAVTIKNKKMNMPAVMPPDKPIDKSKENMLVCQLCKTKWNTRQGMAIHQRFSHNLTPKEYYDIFYKSQNEDICACGKIKKFDSHLFAYRKHCSQKCQSNDVQIKEKRKATCLKKYGFQYPMKNADVTNNMKKSIQNKYGFDNISHLESVKRKKKNTCLKNYGVEVPLQNTYIHNKYSNTCLKKYGVIEFGASQQCISKRKETCMKKYGVENFLETEMAQQKSQKTCMEKYGVRFASQHPLIFNKIKNNSFKRKPYTLPSGKIIYLLGYEPKFLNYIFDNNLFQESQINYSPPAIIYYSQKQKRSYYYPDFYIEKYNVIIEIKSSWTIKKDKNYKKKRNACLKQGYRHILVLDNNFDEFNKFLQSCVD
jgi:hypothetical protein